MNLHGGVKEVRKVEKFTTSISAGAEYTGRLCDISDENDSEHQPS